MGTLARAGTAAAALVAAPVALILVLVLGVAAIIGTVVGAPPPAAAGGVDPAKIPALARDLLGDITTITARSCPELPPLWVIAQVAGRIRVEPRRDQHRPQRRRRRALPAQPGQLDRRGRPPLDDVTPRRRRRHPAPAPPPRTGHPVGLREPAPRRRAPARQRQADRPARRHAGLPHRRLRPRPDSATGIPAPGEAGCDTHCSTLVRPLHRHRAPLPRRLRRTERARRHRPHRAARSRSLHRGVSRLHRRRPHQPWLPHPGHPLCPDPDHRRFRVPRRTGHPLRQLLGPPSSKPDQ